MVYKKGSERKHTRIGVKKRAKKRRKGEKEGKKVLTRGENDDRIMHAS